MHAGLYSQRGSTFLALEHGYSRKGGNVGWARMRVSAACLERNHAYLKTKAKVSVGLERFSPTL